MGTSLREDAIKYYADLIVWLQDMWDEAVWYEIENIFVE